MFKSLKQKIFCAVLLCLFTGSLSACRSENTADSQAAPAERQADTREMSPEAVVEAMTAAFFEARDPEKAYSYWSKAARAKKRFKDYAFESKKILLQTPENAVSYSVELESADEKSASVSLTLRLPDARAISAEMSRREALNAEQQAELDAVQNQKALLDWALKHGVPHFENNDLEVPYEEQSQILALVKEDGGWKVNDPD